MQLCGFFILLLFPLGSLKDLLPVLRDRFALVSNVAALLPLLRVGQVVASTGRFGEVVTATQYLLYLDHALLQYVH